MRFFGIGGMRVNNIPHQTLSELLQFQPETVVIQLGGNDISAASSPNQIYEKLMELTVYLKDKGINNVCVVKIVKRGCFVKSPGLTNDSFNKQRNKINRLLKCSLKDNFINLRVNFPKDYDNQLVHFNDSGLNKQFFAVRRPFFKAWICYVYFLLYMYTFM